MSYTVNLEECGKYFDSMPVPFAILEMVYDNKHQPVDFIFRYANPPMANLDGVPLDHLTNKSFCHDVFPDSYDTKWLSYYASAANEGKIYELHEYSNEIKKYLKIITYPWKADDFCACIFVDETKNVEKSIELDYLASYDSMTKTLNKNSYQEYARRYTSEGETGLIFIDVNGLKTSNDTYGHETGDFLISLVTDRINSVLNSDNIRVFRVGGDEFVAILENTSQEETKNHADALRRKMINKEISHLPKTLASVGIGWAEKVYQLDDLMKQADKDMYIEKKKYYKQVNDPKTQGKYRMWKESYRVGVEHIDKQHMELFRMTAELLDSFDQEVESNYYEETLAFLKEYVVLHFKDEEAYQAEINYPKIKEHQKSHRDFTRTVLEYEKELIENNFDIETLKNLAGSLTAWLIYHIAGEDRRIVSARDFDKEDNRLIHCVHAIAENLTDVLGKIGGFQPDDLYFHMISQKVHNLDMSFSVKFSGELSGVVVFGISESLVLHLLRVMMIPIESGIDELAKSVIGQLISMACDGANHELVQRRIDCKIGAVDLDADCKSPEDMVEATCRLDDDHVAAASIDTVIGGMQIIAMLDVSA